MSMPRVIAVQGDQWRKTPPQTGILGIFFLMMVCFLFYPGGMMTIKSKAIEERCATLWTRVSWDCSTYLAVKLPYSIMQLEQDLCVDMCQAVCRDQAQQMLSDFSSCVLSHVKDSQQANSHHAVFCLGPKRVGALHTPSQITGGCVISRQQMGECNPSPTGSKREDSRLRMWTRGPTVVPGNREQTTFVSNAGKRLGMTPPMRFFITRAPSLN